MTNISYFNKLSKKITLSVLFLFISSITFSQFTMTWGPITAGQTITIPTQGTSYTVDWGYLVGGFPVTSTHTGPATHTFPNPLIGGPDFNISITGPITRIEFNDSGDKDLLKEITSWGTNTFTSMGNAFYGCTNLTTVPSTAPTFSPTLNNMSSAFRDCTSFTGDISGWDVSTVSNMSDMFRGATSFNQDISGWTTTSLTVMARIFRGATSFNQDISGWNTSSVTNMNSVFNGASAFDQNLGALDLSNNPSMNNFLNSAGLSVANYDATLNGWNSQGVGPIEVGTDGMVYCNDGNTSRLALEAAGWKFNTHSACVITLPIELISFEAKKTKQNTIALNWTTAVEINNDFFTLERSSDAIEWEIISKVNGAGNSNEVLNYESSDINPMNGLAYYRLKQTDFDGEFSYSKTVSIHSKFNDNKIIIAIFPNPVENILNIESKDGDLNEIKIYNNLGKEISSITKTLRSSEKKIQLDLSNLPNGIYYILVNDFNTKFFKGK